jgi:hypothetical protein
MDAAPLPFPLPPSLRPPVPPPLPPFSQADRGPTVLATPQNQIATPQEGYLSPGERPVSILSMQQGHWVPLDPHPPWGEWRAVNEYMPDRAEAYQSFVCGAYYQGKAFIVDGVKFDGVNGDRLVEAKGPGLKNKVKRDGVTWQPSFESRESFQTLMNQLKRQNEAATKHGTYVDWYVAEERVASALRKTAEREGYDRLVFHYLPPPPAISQMKPGYLNRPPRPPQTKKTY